MPDPLTPARSPLTDPRPGDRVVSGDGRTVLSVTWAAHGSVEYADSLGRHRAPTLDDWRSWCRRNDARPAAGEGE